MGTVLSKSDFAARVGVHRSRVTQWLKGGKIFGPAIVGTGYSARIRVEAAIKQLRESRDASQIGATTRARLDPIAASGDDAVDVPEPIEARIKAERLEQLVLGNEKLREEAASRNGVFCLAADVRQGEGRLAARLLTVVEAGLVDMADGIAATGSMTPRDALRTLQAAWRGVRIRASKALGEEAAATQALSEANLEDEPL